MDLNEAVDVIRRRNAGDPTVGLAEHSAASVYVMTHYRFQRDGLHDMPAPGRTTRDAAPDIEALGRSVGAMLLARRRTRDGGAPDNGIWPRPPKIEAETGIPWRAGLSLAAIKKAGGGADEVGDDAAEAKPLRRSSAALMNADPALLTDKPGQQSYPPGLDRAAMRRIANADAQRCQDGLRAIQAANERRAAEAAARARGG
jgi:hypothetical protein